MKTLEELIVSIEVEREQAIKQRERAMATVRTILSKANAEGRANLTTEEDQDVKQAFEIRDRIKRELSGIEVKLVNARKAKAAEDEIEAGDRDIREDPITAPAKRPAYDQIARVGAEERTYNAGNCRKGKEFMRDVLTSYLYNAPEAHYRLQRHMKEEGIERGAYLQERAVGTGAFAGLTVPQYLTEMFAPATAALRPFADVCNTHDLPESGMTVNISRITTATSVALQATENALVSETDIDDSLLTENVQTAAGQQTVSRQAIDRGTGIEEVTMQDLFKRYATALDSTLINQATTGLTNVAQNNAYTDATPTAAELWPKLLQAMSGAETAFLGLAVPDFAIMHPRRWYWLQSQVGTTWPFMSQPGIPTQAGGVNLAETYGKGARGILPNGTVAIADANVGTTLGAGTEDEVYIISSDECHLWEDPQAPVFIRAEQAKAANLGVLLVLYGYFAYSFRRYTNGMQKISGTGLIAPVF